METQLSEASSSTAVLKTAGTVIFVGHARLPQSLTARDASPVVSVELETDVLSGVIVGVSARAVPELGARLVAQVLNSRNINDSPVPATEEIRRRYICPSQKALSTAVLNAFESYQRYRQAETA
jgi:hypothetical protein